MAWGIGANDVANSFGTAFGARALTAKQAVMIAAVCELLGAVLMGANVADTIRKGMMSTELYSGEEGRTLMMVGMTSVLFASGSWLVIASKAGLPVSTTHSAVGGVVAFAVASKGYASVQWDRVAMIILSWVVSPAFAGTVGFISYYLLKKLVLSADDRAVVLARSKMAGPFIVFMMTLVVAFFTIYKGGKGIGLDDIGAGQAIGVSLGIAAFFGLASIPAVNWWISSAAPVGAETPEEALPAEAAQEAAPAEIPEDGELINIDVEDNHAEAAATTPLSPKKGAPEGAEQPEPQKDDALQAKLKFPVDEVEKLFRGFVVIVAGFMSLAHGANDVANSVGPFAAVLAASEGELEKKTEIAVWVFCVAGGMICVGLGTYGYRVMQTIGTKVTPLDAPKAFCANFAATLVILIATRAGIPVSTTHASVGAVMGVGLVDGRDNVDWSVMVKIGLSWIITLPICAVAMASVFSFLLPTVLDVPFVTVNSTCAIEISGGC
jgi:sodium-dependent phosphate transporter